MDNELRTRILAGKGRVPKQVVYRSFVHETVMLNLGTGKYHGLNPTAGRMLEVVESASTIRGAATQLAEEYGRSIDEIENDLYDFCLDLRARGLLEIVSDGGDVL